MMADQHEQHQETQKLANLVSKAHRAVQDAQRIAYEPDSKVSLRTRLALNKAQNILIKLLVHKLPPPKIKEED